MSYAGRNNNKNPKSRQSLRHDPSLITHSDQDEDALDRTLHPQAGRAFNRFTGLDTTVWGEGEGELDFLNGEGEGFGEFYSPFEGDSVDYQAEGELPNLFSSPGEGEFNLFHSFEGEHGEGVTGFSLEFDEDSMGLGGDLSDPDSLALMATYNQLARANEEINHSLPQPSSVSRPTTHALPPVVISLLDSSDEDSGTKEAQNLKISKLEQSQLATTAPSSQVSGLHSDSLVQLAAADLSPSQIKYEIDDLNASIIQPLNPSRLPRDSVFGEPGADFDLETSTFSQNENNNDHIKRKYDFNNFSSSDDGDHTHTANTTNTIPKVKRLAKKARRSMFNITGISDASQFNHDDSGSEDVDGNALANSTNLADSLGMFDLTYQSHFNASTSSSERSSIENDQNSKNFMENEGDEDDYSEHEEITEENGEERNTVTGSQSTNSVPQSLGRHSRTQSSFVFDTSMKDEYIEPPLTLSSSTESTSEDYSTLNSLHESSPREPEQGSLRIFFASQRSTETQRGVCPALSRPSSLSTISSQKSINTGAISLCSSDEDDIPVTTTKATSLFNGNTHDETLSTKSQPAPKTSSVVVPSNAIATSFESNNPFSNANITNNISNNIDTPLSQQEPNDYTSALQFATTSDSNNPILQKILTFNTQHFLQKYQTVVSYFKSQQLTYQQALNLLSHRDVHDNTPDDTDTLASPIKDALNPDDFNATMTPLDAANHLASYSHAQVIYLTTLIKDMFLYFITKNKQYASKIQHFTESYKKIQQDFKILQQKYVDDITMMTCQRTIGYEAFNPSLLQDNKHLLLALQQHQVMDATTPFTTAQLPQIASDNHFPDFTNPHNSQNVLDLKDKDRQYLNNGGEKHYPLNYNIYQITSQLNDSVVQERVENARLECKISDLSSENTALKDEVSALHTALAVKDSEYLKVVERLQALEKKMAKNQNSSYQLPQYGDTEMHNDDYDDAGDTAEISSQQHQSIVTVHPKTYLDIYASVTTLEAQKKDLLETVFHLELEVGEKDKLIMSQQHVIHQYENGTILSDVIGHTLNEKRLLGYPGVSGDKFHRGGIEITEDVSEADILAIKNQQLVLEGKLTSSLTEVLAADRALIEQKEEQEAKLLELSYKFLQFPEDEDEDEEEDEDEDEYDKPDDNISRTTDNSAVMDKTIVFNTSQYKSSRKNRPNKHVFVSMQDTYYNAPITTAYEEMHQNIWSNYVQLYEGWKNASDSTALTTTSSTALTASSSPLVNQSYLSTQRCLILAYQELVDLRDLYTQTQTNHLHELTAMYEQLQSIPLLNEKIRTLQRTIDLKSEQVKQLSLENISRMNNAGKLQLWIDLVGDLINSDEFQSALHGDIINTPSGATVDDEDDSIPGISCNINDQKVQMDEFQASNSDIVFDANSYTDESSLFKTKLSLEHINDELDNIMNTTSNNITLSTHTPEIATMTTPYKGSTGKIIAGSSKKSKKSAILDNFAVVERKPKELSPFECSKSLKQIFAKYQSITTQHAQLLHEYAALENDYNNKNIEYEELLKKSTEINVNSSNTSINSDIITTTVSTTNASTMTDGLATPAKSPANALTVPPTPSSQFIVPADHVLIKQQDYTTMKHRLSELEAQHVSLTVELNESKAFITTCFDTTMGGDDDMNNIDNDETNGNNAFETIEKLTEKVSSLQTQLTLAQEQFKSLERTNANLKSTMVDSHNMILNKEEAINKLKSELDILKLDYDTLKDRFDTLITDNNEITRKYDELAAAFDILQQENTTKVSSSMSLANNQQQADEIDILTKQLTSSTSELENIKQKYDDFLIASENQRKVDQNTIEMLQQDILSLEQQFTAQLTSSQATFQELVAEVARLETYESKYTQDREKMGFISKDQKEDKNLQVIKNNSSNEMSMTPQSDDITNILSDDEKFEKVKILRFKVSPIQLAHETWCEQMKQKVTQYEELVMNFIMQITAIIKSSSSNFTMNDSDSSTTTLTPQQCLQITSALTTFKQHIDRINNKSQNIDDNDNITDMFDLAKQTKGNSASNSDASTILATIPSVLPTSSSNNANLTIEQRAELHALRDLNKTLHAETLSLQQFCTESQAALQSLQQDKEKLLKGLKDQMNQRGLLDRTLSNIQTEHRKQIKLFQEMFLNVSGWNVSLHTEPASSSVSTVPILTPSKSSQPPPQHINTFFTFAIRIPAPTKEYFSITINQSFIEQLHAIREQLQQYYQLPADQRSAATRPEWGSIFLKNVFINKLPLRQFIRTGAENGYMPKAIFDKAKELIRDILTPPQMSGPVLTKHDKLSVFMTNMLLLWKKYTQQVYDKKLASQQQQQQKTPPANTMND